MAKKFLARLTFAASLLVGSPLAYSAPILDSLAPVQISYDYGFGNDFTVPLETGFGDVTAALIAVDLLIPSPFASASTSGCQPTDFAGFPAGSIALIQRGDCTFAEKAANAEAAGAAGVLLFNEGNPGRTDASNVTLGAFPATTPVFFASFGVGDFLRNGVSNGSTGFTVHMKVAPEDLAVPEPGTFALLGLGLAGLAASRRRKQ